MDGIIIETAPMDSLPNCAKGPVGFVSGMRASWRFITAAKIGQKIPVRTLRDPFKGALGGSCGR